MKKHFLIFVGVSVAGLFLLTTPGNAGNEHKLSHNEIVDLVSHLNNELTLKDIPALKDKIVVLDMNGNVLFEEALSDFEEKKNSSPERRLVNKSEFLMEYAGDSYYILER